MSYIQFSISEEREAQARAREVAKRYNSDLYSLARDLLKENGIYCSYLLFAKGPKSIRLVSKVGRTLDDKVRKDLEQAGIEIQDVSKEEAEQMGIIVKKVS